MNYLRFFHPSDEAADTDWAQFMIAMLDDVEGARDSASLAAALDDHVATVAPTVRVFATASPPRDEGATPPEADGVIAWEHRGVNHREAVQEGFYSSERVRGPLDVGERPDWFPYPDEPLVVDLGAGISARIPLAVFTSQEETLPATGDPEVAWRNGLSPHISYGRMDADNRGTRIAAVSLTWGVFQHFYPYWDVVASDWDRALEEGLAMAADAPDTPLTDVLRSLVAKAQDGHSVVYSPSESIAGPPLAWAWIENKLIVTEVSESVPDAIQVGAEVIRIDGLPVVAALAAVEDLAYGSTPHDRRSQALQLLWRGRYGSELHLTTQSADGLQQTSVVERLVRSGTYTGDTRPAVIDLLAPEIGYIDLTRLSENDVLGLLDVVEGIENLIVDVRGYPSRQAWDIFPRLLTESSPTAAFSLPITTRPDGEGREFEDVSWEMEPVSPRLASQVVFLTDQRAISAAETLLGIIQESAVADIVGSPTAGTNGNVVEFVVPGGIRVWMTGLLVTNRDGTPHHGVGVRPTVVAERTVAGVIEGRDEVLEAALKLLRP